MLGLIRVNSILARFLNMAQSAYPVEHLGKLRWDKDLRVRASLVRKCSIDGA